MDGGQSALEVKEPQRAANFAAAGKINGIPAMEAVEPTRLILAEAGRGLPPGIAGGR